MNGENAVNRGLWKNNRTIICVTGVLLFESCLLLAAIWSRVQAGSGEMLRVAASAIALSVVIGFVLLVMDRPKGPIMTTEPIPVDPYTDPSGKYGWWLRGQELLTGRSDPDAN